MAPDDAHLLTRFSKHLKGLGSGALAVLCLPAQVVSNSTTLYARNNIQLRQLREKAAMKCQFGRLRNAVNLTGTRIREVSEPDSRI
jgi:hypothetical protein